MSSWKGNLPKLPIKIKYSAIGTRKYSGRAGIVAKGGGDLWEYTISKGGDGGAFVCLVDKVGDGGACKVVGWLLDDMVVRSRRYTLTKKWDIRIRDMILQPMESLRYPWINVAQICEEMKNQCWLITKALANMVEVAELRMLRWTCGKTLLDMIPNGVYRAQLEVEMIINKMREGRLRMLAFRACLLVSRFACYRVRMLALCFAFIVLVCVHVLSVRPACMLLLSFGNAAAFFW
ncbi:hypothetical protein Tco_0740883 [Tanacetum coccineum]